MAMMVEIDAGQVKELLSKGWLTHDAMWFLHCLQSFGIEKTNELNLAAVRSMAGIEARRTCGTLGIDPDQLDSFGKLMEFVSGAHRLIIPRFMKFELTSPETDVLQWRWEECFAHQGVSRLGVADQYQCGVIPRIQTWFDTLGVRYEMDPVIDGCLMQQTGQCQGCFRFTFD